MNAFTVTRPWGNFRQFTHNENSTVKVITVNKGQRFSLQSHSKRDENWYILSGSAKITLNNEERAANKGDEISIPRGTLHRLEATNDDVVFLEVAKGEFDEADIKRVSDDYGRN